jgi:putative phage-type endonuclease
MAQLICERLTQVPAESFTNAAMVHGIDTEPQARAAYEFLTDNPVTEVALVDHPTIPMSSASPDGLVGADGMVEIKCPNSATHISTLLKETVDRKYMLQMQWQMACAERQWCDFVSFDPRLPTELQMWVKRIERNDDMIAETEDIVREFLAEVDKTVADLRAKYMRDAA